MDNKKIISLQIPSELFNLIEADASAEYMSISAFIRKLLIMYYKEKVDGKA